MAAASVGEHKLLVTVQNGRNLFKEDENSNYLIASLYDESGKLIKTEGKDGFFTGQVVKGVNPDWHEHFLFGQKTALDPTQTNFMLLIEIKEKNQFQRDTPLGVAVIPFTDFPQGQLKFSLEPQVTSQRMKSKGSLRNLVKDKRGGGHLTVDFEWQSMASVVAIGDVSGFSLKDESGPAAKEAGEEDEQDGGDEEALLEEEGSRKDPNTLLIRIIRAKNLKAMDTGMLESGKSDPKVVVSLGGKDVAKTATIKKNLNPEWHEEFVVPCSLNPDYSAPDLEISVMDEDTLRPSQFIGKDGPTSMEDFSDREFHLQEDVKLRSKKGTLDEPRGTLTYAVQWIYLKKNDRVPAKKGGLMGMRRMFSKKEETFGDVEDDANEPVPELSKADKQKQLEEEQKQKEEEAALLSGIKVESGDYQVQVHILEARDLAPKDLSGTSDPVTYVKLFGQQQNTAVKDPCISCVFDEVFIFEKRNLDKEEFEDLQIQIDVMDADSVTRNDVIGSYTADLKWIYFRKDHELHRAWVGLVNQEEPEQFPGVQGFLKVSIQVVGPNDKLVVHDEKAERRHEAEADETNADGLSGLVIMPPSIKPEVVWLKTTVWQAEYLPRVDLTTGGIDAIFRVYFGDGNQVSTVCKKVKGTRDKLKANFTTQLWTPMVLPTSTKYVRLVLGDLDAGGAVWNTQATTYFSLGDLQKMHRVSLEKRRRDKEAAAPPHSALGVLGGSMKNIWGGATEEDKAAVKKSSELDAYNGHFEDEAYWVPMYGSHCTDTRSLAGLATAIKKGVAEVLGPDWKLHYNTHPDDATTYRGRVLVSHKLVPHDKVPDAPHKIKVSKEKKKAFRNLINMKSLSRPTEAPLVLAAVVVSGSQLPCTDAQLVVSCGRYECPTTRIKCTKSTARWSTLVSTEAEDMRQPADPSQLPDVFVHLVNGDKFPIAFKRFSAPDLLKRGFSAEPVVGWVDLENDRSMGVVDSKEFPGTVLISVGLGTQEQWAQVRDQWQTAPASAGDVTAQLRVHLYQCRNLPNLDSDAGGIDPFAKISFAGEELRSSTKKNNTNPLFYETHMTSTVTVPANSAHLDRVCVRFFDYDFGQSPDYVGMFFHQLEEADISDSANFDPTPPRPVWRKLLLNTTQANGSADSGGRVLASFQLVRLFAGMRPEDLAPPPSLEPLTRKAALEILCIGIRDMTPFNFLPIQLPSMKFTLEGMSTVMVPGTKMGPDGNPLPQAVVRPTCVTHETATSKKPNPSNANFLDRVLLEVDLPEDTIFAPALQMEVFDTRLGGLLKEVVGKTSVDLAKLCEWNPDYIPRDNSMLDMEANRLRVLEKAGVAVMRNGQDDKKEEQDAGKGGEAPDMEEGEAKAGAEGATRDAAAGGKLVGQGGQEEVKEEEAGEASGGSASGSQGGQVEGPAGQGSGDGGGGGSGGGNGTSEKGAASEQSGPMEGDADLGLGVFPALHHVSSEDNMLVKRAKLKEQLLVEQQKKREHLKRLRKLKQERMEAEAEEDSGNAEPEEEPEYMKGREVLDEELESTILGTPFDTYELSLGSKSGSLFSPPDWRHAGYFKGMVRVLKSKDEPALFDLSQVFKPTPVKVRLYVLKALQLAAKDASFNGRPGRSDPYLKVQLGKESFNGVDDHFSDLVEVDFYTMVELQTEIPGACVLNLDVYDYDDFGSDDLIGRTTIDLEDRWFDKRWSAMGGPPNDDPDKGPLSWTKKPLELRSLHVPTTRSSQGKVQCWVDLLRPDEAAAYAPFDVALPPILLAEVRLVVWKAREVPAMDTLEQMNDMYVKCWLEGSKPQLTDTHWRAKKGKASWNYRMKFDVELGQSTMLMKFPYLRIQTWDKDVLKWNDLISEKTIDVGRHLEKAYQKQEMVDVYKDPPKKKEAAETEKLLKEAELDGVDLSNPEELERVLAKELVDLGLDDGEAGAPSGLDPAISQQPQPHSAAPVEEAKVADDARTDAASPEGGELDEDADALLPEAASPGASGEDTGTAAAGAGAAARDKARKKKKAVYQQETWGEWVTRLLCWAICSACMLCKGQLAWCPGSSCCRCFPPCYDLKAKKTKVRNGKGGEDGDDALDEKTQELIDQVKDMLGMEETKPKDSEWLQMDKKDEKTGTRLPMGKLCISLQIVPKNLVDGLPAGFGRTSPNANPYLPPPTGRLKFSLNPFVMGSQLCGPKLCAYFTCCLLCAGVMALMIFCQPVLNLFVYLFVAWLKSR